MQFVINLPKAFIPSVISDIKSAVATNAFYNVNRWRRHHPLWLVAIMVGLVISIASWVFQDADNYLFFSVGAQPRLALFYCVAAILNFFVSDYLFSKRKFRLYFILLPFMILALSWVANLVSPYADLEAGTAGASLFFQIISISFFVALGAFLRGLKSRVQQKQEYFEYKSRALEAELGLLRQQLNEHFLFNTLNSIYVNVLDQKEEAADMVIKLSEMLRYSLVYNAKESISLEDELAFIRHYIYFEQRRLPTNVQVDFQTEVLHSAATLSPNLLMPLIENSVKHGSNTRETTTIRIKISADITSLELTTENTVYPVPKHKSSYTGQQNLRTRLHHLYPGRHFLSIKQENNMYKTQLRINLN